MARVSNIAGCVFGRLTVLKRNGSSCDGKAMWLCRCSCGTIKPVMGKHLRSGATVSCGCFSRETTSLQRRLNIRGNTFGRLTAIDPIGPNPRGDVVWKFLCNCGTYCEVPASAVKSGNTKSCGCLQPEAAATSQYRHGLAHTPTYTSWASMIQRCTNSKLENFPHYGGRGVGVCERWLKFENFLEDMGVRPPDRTLGRVNNEEGYSPGNCRWEVTEQQSMNKRNTAKVIHNGIEMTLRKACSISGVSYERVVDAKHKHDSTHQVEFDRIQTIAAKVWPEGLEEREELK